jgi:hypothetical protein
MGTEPLRVGRHPAEWFQPGKLPSPSPPFHLVPHNECLLLSTHQTCYVLDAVGRSMPHPNSYVRILISRTSQYDCLEVGVFREVIK